LLDVIILIGNVYGNNLVPFRVIALIAIAGSYLIRYVEDDGPSALISALLFIAIYCAFLGFYRILVYNRYLDPLLEIPGPKVVFIGTLADDRDTGSKG
jgi:hypothetical protein